MRLCTKVARDIFPYFGRYSIIYKTCYEPIIDPSEYGLERVNPSINKPNYMHIKLGYFAVSILLEISSSTVMISNRRQKFNFVA